MSAENEVPQSPPQEKTQQILDKKRSALLLFLSFKYSQGDKELQRLFFHLMQQKGIKLRTDITREASAMTEKFITPDRHTMNLSTNFLDSRRKFAIQDNIEWAIHESELFTKPDKPIEVLLFENILSSDFRFLISKGDGRPRVHDIGGRELTRNEDPFLSHLVYYGILGHKTGDEFFDEVFAIATKYLSEHYEKIPAGIKGDFQAILQIWNKHHPAQQIQWPPNSEAQ